VEQGYGVDAWAELRGGVILGMERFVEELRPLLKGQADTGEIPRRERLVARPKLEELMSGAKGFKGTAYRLLLRLPRLYYYQNTYFTKIDILPFYMFRSR